MFLKALSLKLVTSCHGGEGYLVVSRELRGGRQAHTAERRVNRRLEMHFSKHTVGFFYYYLEASWRNLLHDEE